VGHGKGSGNRWPQSGSCVSCRASATLVPNSASSSLFAKVHRVGIWLTLPSRGCPKGCAFCAPLMSNVRPSCMNSDPAPSYADSSSQRISSLGGSLAVMARVECRLRAARAARPSAVGALPVLCQERKLSCHSRSGSLVKQRLQNSAFVHVRFIKESTATVFHGSGLHFAQNTVRRSWLAERQLVSKRAAVQRSWCRPSRPNPSIEGRHKRLRLLCTPHVKR
jgi:hypothetical protein